MCWEINDDYTIESLRAAGFKYAHIEGRGFYLNLDTFEALDKKSNLPRVKNPLTYRMVADKIWKSYEPVEQKPLAPVVPLKLARPLFAVIDTESGEVQTTFHDEQEAQEYAEAENELYGDPIYASVRYARA